MMFYSNFLRVNYAKAECQVLENASKHWQPISLIGHGRCHAAIAVQN